MLISCKVLVVCNIPAARVSIKSLLHGMALLQAAALLCFVRLQEPPAVLALSSDTALQELGDNEDSGLSLRPRDLASMFWAYGSLHFVPPEIDTLCQVRLPCSIREGPLLP